MFDQEMIDPSKQIHYFRQGQSSGYVPESDTFFGGTCLEMVGGRPTYIFNKSSTRLLEFPVRICDALHITTHTRRT